MNLQPARLRTVVALLCAFGLRVAAQAWQSDQGDGTYRNPVLYADYPDPDIIRVGEDYYFATTTFVDVPGVLILHSKDLVNWELACHVVPRLEGSERYDMIGGVAYRHGLFATSLRYHSGTFYAVVTPVGQHTRIYSTTDLRNPWHCSELDRAAFDPGFFIDSDGTGYIATSVGSDGHIKLLTLDSYYHRVIAAQEIDYIKGAEGSHLIKRGGWYYLFNAIPRRMALTVSRARQLTGPWETTSQLDDRSGGHQGALVDLPDGRWFGFVMVDAGAIGRMTNLSPVFWRDDWPVWGTPAAPGRVPRIARKPIQGQPIRQPATSDDFQSPELGLQWQWNHNPDNSRWSLTEHPGYLRLKPTQAAEFWTARNTLTQKGQGPWSRGELTFNLSGLKPGDTCGFGTLGKFCGHIAVHCGPDGSRFLSMEVIEDTQEGRKTETRVAREPLLAKTVTLRTDLDFESRTGLCAYRTDGGPWQTLGGTFPLAFDWRTGTFQGEKFAMFCLNSGRSDGHVDVGPFKFYDQP
jgi:beta-xylosidase